MNQCSHCGKFKNLYMDTTFGIYWCAEYIATEHGYIKEKGEMIISRN